MSIKSKFLKSATLAIAGFALTTSLSACKGGCKEKCDSKKEKHGCASKDDKAGCASKDGKSSCASSVKDSKASCASKDTKATSKKKAN